MTIWNKSKFQLSFIQNAQFNKVNKCLHILGDDNFIAVNYKFFSSSLILDVDVGY